MNNKQYFNINKEPYRYNWVVDDNGVRRISPVTNKEFKGWIKGRGESLEPVGEPTQKNLDYIGSDPRSYTGVNFADGIVKDGYNLVCLDLDVKKVSDENIRNQFFLEVMEAFDLPYDYKNVERTKSKGYHIWLLIALEEEELFNKKVYVLNEKLGVELEVFFRNYAVVVYDKTAVRYSTMIRLKEYPELHFKEETLEKSDSKGTNPKDYKQVETLEEHIEIFKNFYPKPPEESDYSTLAVFETKEKNIYSMFRTKQIGKTISEVVIVEKLDKVYKIKSVKGQKIQGRIFYNPTTKKFIHKEG